MGTGVKKRDGRGRQTVKEMYSQGEVALHSSEKKNTSPIRMVGRMRKEHRATCCLLMVRCTNPFLSYYIRQ